MIARQSTPETRPRIATKPPTTARMPDRRPSGGNHAAHPDGDHHVPDPVFERNGALCLRVDGHASPIVFDAEPVVRLLHGWRATALHAAFAPLLLPGFQSDAGSHGGGSSTIG